MLVLGFALMLRVIFLSESMVYNPTFFTPIIDAYTYNKLALAQVSGAGMGPESVWQPLFYPYFLSAGYYIFGYGFFSARIVQILLGLFICVFTYLLGVKLFTRKVGLVAALLVAICGPLIFYEGELLPATWEVFWFLMSIGIFLKLAPDYPEDGRTEDVNRRGAKDAEVEDEVENKEMGQLRGVSSLKCHSRGSGNPALNASLLDPGFRRDDRIRVVPPIIDPLQNKAIISSLRLARLRRGLCGEKGNQFRIFLLFGIISAVGVVIRPTVLLFYVAALGWVIGLYLRRFSWKRLSLLSGGAVAGMALIFVPVVIRNHSLTRHWILFPLSGGLNFYIGNNPEAERTVAIRPGDQWYQLTVSPRREGVFYASEGPRYFYKKSFEYIRNRPVAFLNGLARKTELLFSAREIPRNIDIYLFRKYSVVLGMLVWRMGGFGFPMGIIIPFALFGAVINFRRFRRLACLYLYVATYSISIVLFFVSSRYRLPLLPVLCLFAASGICCICDEFRRNNYLRIIGSLAALAVMFIYCNRFMKIPEDAVNFESELYMALGTVHLERGERGQGEYYLKKSVDADPQNADAHNLLGVLKLQKGEVDGAREEFAKTLEIQSRHVGAFKNLGRLYQRMQKWDKSRDYYLRAAELDPGSDEIHSDLASLYENTGDLPEAAREYWKALELKPDSIAVRRRLSMALGRLGRWDAAREIIAEAVRHEPDNAELRCDLGTICGNMGRNREAIVEFEKAVRIRRDNPVALLNMGLLYQRIGDTERARVQYEKLKLVDSALAETLARELVHP